MPNALADATLSTESKASVPGHLTPLLIATDGTTQSEAAIAMARLLTQRDGREVRVLTVIDRVPIPWGTDEPSLVTDYEKGLQEEAQRKVNEQVVRLGETGWTVEVRSGDPATTIAAAAKESRAHMVVVGLGGHGPAARFFGNETALRLMRTGETPVLAVESKSRGLPKRIEVAMDFSEPSIEAARLALEIAAPGAMVTLVHVVPWEKKDYIPEHWFREHEAHISAQLTRVTGWLDRSRSIRMHQRILYGKAGPALLSCADALDADLIVAGTHGRGLFGRLLGGETIAKIVRGARRSVLVLPAAASFRRFTAEDLDNLGRDEHADWARKLDDFSRRNAGRRGRLEVDAPAVGAQVEMTGYRFLGAVYDSPSQRAHLMFGSTEQGEPHLVRGMSNIKSIDILPERGGKLDRVLSIVSDDGQTLLFLDDAKKGR